MSKPAIHFIDRKISLYCFGGRLDVFDQLRHPLPEIRSFNKRHDSVVKRVLLPQTATQTTVFSGNEADISAQVDARSLTTGEVVFRDSMAHGVAGIVQADYCLDGREQLIVVSVSGEVRGYLPASAELRQQMVDATFEQDTVRELSRKKQVRHIGRAHAEPLKLRNRFILEAGLRTKCLGIIFVQQMYWNTRTEKLPGTRISGSMLFRVRFSLPN
ncbi:hypothetical protein HPB51_017725 [Rhipicephalus microplus]|uniref:Uncharacterized protein n=1 Tax=Rhipicephalus microplus TaxID=6941 RepID=A0A9J6E287_RHIMP|nr:hypothetical protein HPB51_017725 [Rhipicephalus microplus]